MQRAKAHCRLWGASGRRVLDTCLAGWVLDALSSQQLRLLPPLQLYESSYRPRLPWAPWPLSPHGLTQLLSLTATPAPLRQRRHYGQRLRPPAAHALAPCACLVRAQEQHLIGGKSVRRRSPPYCRAVSGGSAWRLVPGGAASSTGWPRSACCPVCEGGAARRGGRARTRHRPAPRGVESAAPSTLPRGPVPPTARRRGVVTRSRGSGTPGEVGAPGSAVPKPVLRWPGGALRRGERGRLSAGAGAGSAPPRLPGGQCGGGGPRPWRPAPLPRRRGLEEAAFPQPSGGGGDQRAARRLVAAATRRCNAVLAYGACRPRGGGLAGSPAAAGGWRAGALSGQPRERALGVPMPRSPSLYYSCSRASWLLRLP